MSNPWFRMYVDFLTDSKMISIAFEDQRHFIGILALKSSGILDQTSSDAMMNRIVSQRLWIDHSLILDVKKRLIDAGLIGPDWQPLAWEKRQRKSDLDPTKAERQQRYRESNALRNGSVTGLDKIRIEEIREDKTEEKKRPRKKATRIAADWTPSDSDKEVAIRIKQMTPDEMQVVADEFRDYWLSKADGAMVDWSATWRNWIRRRAKWEQERNPASAITAKKYSYTDN